MSDAKYAMFIKAIDKKSLALAAQELCCTPSAVSHGISALETELGLRLMKRSRGGVELTAEGEHVIGAVRGVLGENYRITRCRGQWFERGGVPVLATYHPSALLRDQSKKREAWEDLKLVRQKLLELQLYPDLLKGES